MRQTRLRLALACGCALVTAAFAGGALAGNGNENAPGQQKKAEAAAPAQPAPEQSTQASAQVQSTQSAEAQSSHSSHVPPGQAKKQSTSAGSSSSSSASTSTQAGVKPSSTTSKWTHCRTNSAGCKAEPGTPDVGPDVSKRYGNGQTAAQIANSRGAPDGTLITGPGNSQPHKVTACGKPNNKSGGVDVHAVKSYDASACQPKTVTPVAPSVQVSHVCGQDTIVTTSSQAAALHGKHQHPMTNQKSAHFTKHADTQIMVTLTETKVVATGEVCNAQQPVTPPVVVTPAPAPTAPAPAPAPATPTPAPVAPVVQPTAQVAPVASAPTGNVLGVHTTVKPKSKPAGGVLGQATNVAGTSLPFTGFPIWAAVLIAAGLLGSGLVLRHRAARV